MSKKRGPQSDVLVVGGVDLNRMSFAIEWFLVTVLPINHSIVERFHFYSSSHVRNLLLAKCSLYSSRNFDHVSYRCSFIIPYNLFL